MYLFHDHVPGEYTVFIYVLGLFACLAIGMAFSYGRKTEGWNILGSIAFGLWIVVMGISTGIARGSYTHNWLPLAFYTYASLYIVWFCVLGKVFYYRKETHSHTRDRHHKSQIGTLGFVSMGIALVVMSILFHKGAQLLISLS